MKNIFISILMILVLNCGGGGGGSSPDPTNCEQCPFTSIQENSCADLNASGCINMIGFGYEVCDTGPLPTCGISIYYNTDFNITGFQFDIENMINLNLSNDYNFILESSEPPSINGTRVLGYTLDGSVIPSGCGILMSISYQVSFGGSVLEIPQIFNITFTDDTVNDDFSPNIIDVCPL